MKILIALLMAAALLGCGKKKSANAPSNTGTDQTGTTQSGTGGSTYGGANQTPTPPEGAAPAGGQ